MDAPLDLEGLFVRMLRSGKGYTQNIRYSVTKVGPSFNLSKLLQTSTVEEAEFWERGEDEAPKELATPGVNPPSPPIARQDGRQPATPSPCWALRRPAESKISLKDFRKKRKRDELVEEEGHIPRASVVKRHMSSAPLTKVDMHVADLPVASGAYQAKNVRVEGAADVWSAEALVRGRGFTLVPWDGITSQAFVDQDSHIFLVLAGRPNEAGYLHAADAVYKLMKEEADAAGFGAPDPHRRGCFPVINVGVTHGNGTEHPVYRNNNEHTAMADRLLDDANVKRLANFASSCFQMWVPKVYDYYRDRLHPLFKHMPSLRRIFKGSIFPAAAFNFGPNVWTFKHRDVFNCPFGFCSIQALGRFDPKKGGHIILWEPRLVVEFPPASLVLIPSATVTHSNTPVAEGEERASFTQYCPGGLFRYVDSGFRTEKYLKAADPALYEKMQAMRPKMWEIGLNLLSKPEDFGVVPADTPVAR